MKLPKMLLTVVCGVGMMLGLAIPGLAVVDHTKPMLWTELDSGTTEVLNDVWGSGSNNVFAVGSNGTILHYNGTSWSSMSSPVVEDVNSIWGRSATDIYAVGDSGVQLHYNGSTWSSMGAIPHPVGIVSDVYGSSTETYCTTYGDIDGGIGGGEVMKLYGGNWESTSSERFCDTTDCMSDRQNDRLNAIYVQESTGDVYVGGYGPIDGLPVLWRKTDSSGFHDINNGSIQNYQAILGIWGIGNTTFFTGVNYTIGQNNNTGIVLRDINGQRTMYTLNGYGDIFNAWGTATNNVFFAVANGDILHFNGSTWIDSITGVSADLHGVWGSNDGDVFAVGDNGTILHYDVNNPATGAILIAPADNSVQPENTVSFGWSPVSWATGYRLQISETDDMSRLIFDSSVGAATSIDINGFEGYGRPYFWRVFADDGYGHSIASEIFRFDNGTALSTILITPGNGDNIPGTSINFQWYPFESSTGYYFQLATDANYANILAQGMVYNTEITLNAFGDDGTSYYWRVLDYDGTNFGAYWSYSNLFVNGTP